jgi:hypothetical protein
LCPADGGTDSSDNSTSSADATNTATNGDAEFTDSSANSSSVDAENTATNGDAKFTNKFTNEQFDDIGIITTSDGGGRYSLRRGLGRRQQQVWQKLPRGQRCGMPDWRNLLRCS